MHKGNPYSVVDLMAPGLLVMILAKIVVVMALILAKIWLIARIGLVREGLITHILLVIWLWPKVESYRGIGLVWWILREMVSRLRLILIPLSLDQIGYIRNRKRLSLRSPLIGSGTRSKPLTTRVIGVSPILWFRCKRWCPSLYSWSLA